MLLDVIKCLCLCAVTVQAGPLVMTKSRPVAGPLVDTAQWTVHREYLMVEKKVLAMSLDVSRIAHKITTRAYQTVEEAEDRLHGLQDMAHNEIQISTTECEQNMAIRKNVNDTIHDALLHIFRCEHGIADKMADLELKMTEKVIDGRGYILEVKRAMWLCQKNLPKPDKPCLHKLISEGLQIAHHLVHTARPVLLEAQKAGEEALGKINYCFEKYISGTLEKIVRLTEELRECNAQRTDVSI